MISDLDITIGARSEATGRFNFVRGADGDVSFDGTQAHAVVTSATEALGSWWANPDHGCQLRQLRSITSTTPSQAESMTFASLDSLERDGSIVNVTVEASVSRAPGQPIGRLKRRIRWSTPSGSGGDQGV